MGSGMSKITNGLFLGNIRVFLFTDSEDKASLAKNGVTHILSVHNSAKTKLQEMKYLCISASDSSSQNLLQHFKECIKFIHECRLQGGGCLVHCLAGISRSTTILVAYLMTVTSFGWEDCLCAVKAARSYVFPNLGFQQQLQEYEMTLLKEYRAWLRLEYGGNPFSDQENVQRLISQQAEKETLLVAQNHYINQPRSSYSLPYKAYASCSKDWADR
uniref:Dual specificity protein phosphatase 22 n=1 Tax=Geotrypetes seraphini TaxID=260995 RepID=A0A6P8QM98_GEOSA|nr:dual specificity protein phosphatase 22-A-like isoform X1 [Geotrypetes seraphini]